jgi:AcrR family transcriptional regulator
LLKSAISVLTANGYGKFTTAEVARVAGTSRGAQTHHFPSTQAFILAAIDYLYANILKRSEQRARAVEQGADLLEPILRDGKDFLFGTEFLSLYNTLVEMRNSGAGVDIDEMGVKYRAPVERIWAGYLQGRGVEPACAENVVWTIFSVLRGLAVRRILPHDPAQIDRTLEFAMDSVRKNIRFTR